MSATGGPASARSADAGDDSQHPTAVAGGASARTGGDAASTELENAYERHQHERLCLRLGFGDAWVRAIEERDPSRAKFLSAAERAVQTLMLAVLRRHGKGTASELEALVAVGRARAGNRRPDARWAVC